MRGMLVLAVLMLSACSSEPDFDERYAAAEKQINKTAQEIDSELNSRSQQADMSGGPESDVAPEP